MELLTFLVIGLVAGFVSSKVLKTGDHGLAINTVVGAFGAYTGTTIAALAGIAASTLPVTAAIGLFGALVLPVVLKAIPSA